MTTEKLIKERKIKRLKRLFTPTNFEQIRTDILFRDNSRWEYEFDKIKLVIYLYEATFDSIFDKGKVFSTKWLVFKIDELCFKMRPKGIFVFSYDTLIEKLYCEFEKKIVIDNTMQLSFL